MAETGGSSPPPRRLVTCRDAAAFLGGISERTLWGMRDAIKPIKVGRLVRYDVRDLEAWIERQKVTVPA